MRKQAPPILQSEAAECGIACLAMIAHAFGKEISLFSLRQQLSISLRGTSLRDLIVGANQIGLTARPLRVEPQGLVDVRTPCILHWGFNHFVVLCGRTRQGFRINDPRVGSRVVSEREFGELFTGIALELSPTNDFKPSPAEPPTPVSKLLGHVIGLRPRLVEVLVLGLVLELFAIVPPLVIQWIIDQAISSATVDLLWLLGFMMVMIATLHALTSAVRGWAVAGLNADLGLQWTRNTFAHLLRLPIKFFERRTLGDVVSRFESIATIQRAITNDFVEAIIDGLLAVGTLAMMIAYSPALAIISISIVTVYVAVRIATYQSSLMRSREQIVHAARQESLFYESVRGIQTLRMLGKEAERVAIWGNVLTEQFNAKVSADRIAVLTKASSTWLFGIERATIICLSAMAVMTGKFSLGMLFAFLAYREQFAARMGALIDRYFDFRLLRTHTERLADVVQAPAEPVHSGRQCTTSDEGLSVVVSNVSFRYAERDIEVLRDFTMEVNKGEWVAITGPSGCGKTTLAKLLLGLLVPTAGDIRFDGLSHADIGTSRFVDEVGAVMQDDHLFMGSIADNICFFDGAADHEWIEACAIASNIHNEILEMPMRYETYVGDTGTAISGGQRQRILLARALYRRPKLLILDEATSHLDTANEIRLNESISRLNITRIVIAHRQESIRVADRVIEMSRPR